MTLTPAQQTALERLRLATASGVFLPVALGRLGSAAARCEAAGLVTVTREKGKTLYAITDKGAKALAANHEQMALFVREPGISDVREAAALRQLEAAVRQWRKVSASSLPWGEAESRIDVALAALDDARKRA